MASKRYSLTVHGKRSTWNFDVEVDPKYIEEWRADGIEIDESLGTIPLWVVDIGLARPWWFIQDVFHFRNPLR